MRRGLANVVVVSAVALTLGCGGSGGSSIPIDQWGNERAAVFCHKMFTCCDASERMSTDAAAVDEATCRSNMSASPDIALLQSEVASGRVVFHGDRARSCLDTVAALSCQEWGADFLLIRFPVCPTIFEGTVATGGACASDAECSGGHCGSSTGGRVCTAPAQLGESCDFAKCGPGLACRTDESVAPRMCGQPLPDGTPCFESQDCISGYCISDGAGMATCGLFPSCDGV